MRLPPGAVRRERDGQIPQAGVLLDGGGQRGDAVAVIAAIHEKKRVGVFVHGFFVIGSAAKCQAKSPHFA